MITDAFDSSRPLISTEDIIGEKKFICDKCMVVFSKEIMDNMLDNYKHEKVSDIRACNGFTPIYLFEADGERFISYLTHVGASCAGNDVIEVNWVTGATKFVMFGSAGSLNREATSGKYVIPCEAYREEGMSYHYAPPADYIKVKNYECVKNIFDEIHVPYVVGKTWTTDAFYRETKDKFEKRTAEGCLAVEMEVSGVQAVCDYLGFELYNFLMTGDVLSDILYDVSGLHKANHDMDKFFIALEILKRI